ncbi:MAG: orotidine 5'-phosphate decarboxylase / HUMPS family protein [Nitrososphaerota archaeon]|nr:orotidine 5'-phosphate decarboxylase [Candidatus Calditenuaceae archaeon]MDW8073701.1 orotidine 5'-phosphate decarboxylase / HUMPS family protein [Nitrososphaerota archaeon]
MSILREKYDRAVELSGSILCLGLDPPPWAYPEPSDRLRFCLDRIRLLSRYCSAVKINENHIRGLGEDGQRAITDLASRLGLLTILDCKMGDISETVRAGVRTVSRLGYDSFTVNPFFGNVKEVAEESHDAGLGVFLLAHPSGNYGDRYFREVVAGEPLFWKFIREGVEASVDGYVLGLSQSLREEDIVEIRRVVGDDAVILAPGLGAQGGDPSALIRGGGERILFNVGRSIILSENPASKAAEVSESLAREREFILTSRAIISTRGVLNVYDKPVQLSSGGWSRIYIDCRALYSDPASRSLIARLMVGAISRRVGRSGFEIATTATAGIPLASIVADRLGVGLVYVRMEKKAHGLERRVEGVVKPGEVYVGVDDVATTGKSALECVKAVREEGGVIEKYFVIFDRSEGAEKLLREAGVELYSLARMNDEFLTMAGVSERKGA